MKSSYFTPLCFDPSVKPDVCLLQVLYQAVNYQMEPVNAAAADVREADEPDAAKVGVLRRCRASVPLSGLCVFLLLHI